MIIEILKSKIHRARVTQAELNYVGSITIDEDLLDAANIIPNEKVQIVNNNNGARFETYVIRGEESGIPGVAVKCVDIRRNTGGVDGFLDHKDRKRTRLNSSHLGISYAVFCL